MTEHPSINPKPEADAQRRADLLYAVSRVLSDGGNLTDTVPALLSALGQVLGWDYAALWLPAADSQTLYCADTWVNGDGAIAEFAQASREWRFERGRGLPGRCWTEARAIWLSAVQRDHTLPRVKLARAAHLLGGLAFPIINSGRVAGVIECFTREPEAISPELLNLTEGIGRQIGQFLQRKAVEERLEENEARYSAIVKGALDAIIAIDEDGRVLEFNPAAERMFGYARDEAVGREMAALIIPPDYREGHRQGLQRHRASSRSSLLERRLELRACRRDGTQFPVELTITRTEVRGHWSFLGFLRDITERQNSEREREELSLRERQAHDSAVAANALKDEFLAALSHELRTPLNAILGWSAMLKDSAVDPSRHAAIADTILRNAQAQQRLIEDMLDISSFIAGRVRINLEPITLDEPVQAACESVKPAADAKQVRLHVSVPKIPLHGDRTRLQQVFWNLFSNAVKFTPPGGSVRAEARTENGVVAVAVIDSGQGIDPVVLPFVFDRFRQGSDSRVHGGLGLGLAIVKQIVEAHGGTVSAHSAGRGKGAMFEVRLPSTKRQQDLHMTSST